MPGPPRLLLEGRPGVGKTTLAARLVELLREDGVPVAGFITREIRDRGRRVGFSVQAVGGEPAVLAHIEVRGPPRVGRYGVDLATFERVALRALADVASGSVVVIDELGKMELFSERFRAAVLELFGAPVPVAATVMASRHQFTDTLKRNPSTDVIAVTRANRDTLPAELVPRLTANLPGL